MDSAAGPHYSQIRAGVSRHPPQELAELRAVPLPDHQWRRGEKGLTDLREFVHRVVHVRPSGEQEHHDADSDCCGREPSRAPEAERDRRRCERERCTKPDERQAEDAQQRDDEASSARLVRTPDDTAEQHGRDHEDDRRAEEEDRWILQSRIVPKQVVDGHRSQTKRDAGAR